MKITYPALILLGILQTAQAIPFKSQSTSPEGLEKIDSNLQRLAAKGNSKNQPSATNSKNCPFSKLQQQKSKNALKRAGSDQEMWISKVDHGKSSFNTDPNYKVYRNVKEFGCKGDGVTDDTACINAAIQEGKRCGAKCGSSTLTPAVVYFPSGKYLISSPIVMYYFTQLVGNALNPPTLIASSGFEGMAMIDSNPYIDGGNGDQWYVNQNNFFRQVRNLNLDTTQAPLEKVTTAIHWQVAQATSLTNLKFIMPTDPKTKHQGIWMENGSGGFMSDLTFIGGNYGMWVGNQQFLTRNLSFKNCNTAVLMNWVRINKKIKNGSGIKKKIKSPISKFFTK